jgi:hypothetical protein
LRQDHDPAKAAVEAIGKREIHDPVLPAKGHGRLGTIARQRLEASSLAPGQDQSQNIPHRIRLLLSKGNISLTVILAIGISGG